LAQVFEQLSHPTSSLQQTQAMALESAVYSRDQATSDLICSAESVSPEAEGAADSSGAGATQSRLEALIEQQNLLMLRQVQLAEEGCKHSET